MGSKPKNLPRSHYFFPNIGQVHGPSTSIPGSFNPPGSEKTPPRRHHKISAHKGINQLELRPPQIYVIPLGAAKVFLLLLRWAFSRRVFLVDTLCLAQTRSSLIAHPGKEPAFQLRIQTTVTGPENFCPRFCLPASAASCHDLDLSHSMGLVSLYQKASATRRWA